MPSEIKKYKNSFNRKIEFQIILFLLLVGAGFLFAGHYFFSSERKEASEKVANELKAISQLKISQLTQWHRERESEALFFSSSPYDRYILNLLKGDNRDSLSLWNALSRMTADFRYENIFVIGRDGDLKFSVDPDFELVDEETVEHAHEVFSGGEIAFSDLYYCSTHEIIHFEIFAPVFDPAKNVAAILVFRVDPSDFLFQMIVNLPLPSQTAESYVVRLNRRKDSVLFLSEVKERENTALKLAIPLTRADNVAVKAITGKAGITEGVDYRGEEVFADIEKIPGTPWYIITKIDQKELLEGVRQKAVLFYLVVILAVLFLIAIVAWIYHLRQKNFYRELLQEKSKTHQAQEEFGVTLYSIGDGIIVSDPAGRIKNMNPVAETMTGWEEKEAKGKKIEEVFHIVNEKDRSPVENPVEKVIREGKIVGLANHTLLLSKNGGEIPISDSGAPIKDKEGNLLGVILVFSDQSEERLRRRLVNTRLKLFEYSVGHTLKETLVRMLDEIEDLGQSSLGFLHFLDEDQETLKIQAWSTRTTRDFCNATPDRIHNNLSKAGLWADCIRERRPLIHNDFARHSGKKGMPGGHPMIIRELVVPVIRDNKIRAVLGIGNKPTDYTTKDLEIVNYLADLIWEIAEHKLNLEKIRESKEKMLSIFRGAPTGIGIEKDRIITEVNPRFCEITGYAKEELTGRSSRILYPSEEAFTAVEQVLNDGLMKFGTASTETRWKRKDGAVIDVYFASTSIDPEDPSKGFTFTALDITSRKKAEVESKEQERRLNSMVGNLRGFVYRCRHDKSWTMLYLSSQCEEITGYRPEELVQNNRVSYNSLIIPGHQSYVLDESEKALQRRSPFEYEYQITTAQNELKWVWERGTGVFNAQGNLLFLEGYIEDITQRKETEIQLLDSETKFRNLFQDHSAVKLIIDPPTGDIVDANPAAAEFYGWGIDALKTMNIAQINVLPREALRKKMEEARSAKNIQFEFKHRRANGQETDVEVFSSKVRIGGKEYLHSIIHDISARKKSERELKEAKLKAEESDRLKSAFLANMSHEIRTPMNGILGFINLLDTPDLDEENRKEYLKLVNKSGLRLMDTINDIIEISKIESGETEVVLSDTDVSEIMQYHLDFFKPQAEEKGIALKIAGGLTGEKAIVKADYNKLNSILTNFVKNAIKFTQKGEIELGNYLENGSLVFYVKDTGKGIPAGKKEMIFERFSQADISLTREHEGSGLGLAISKAYTESLGGNIWFTSQPDAGSTFFFSIPYEPAG